MSSPEIASLSRGQMKARSSSKPQKYCRVLPGESQAWDWRETKKSEHYPCMLPAGVEEVIKKDVQMLAIDQGMGEVLKVPPSTREYLKTQGTGVWVIQTELELRFLSCSMSRSHPHCLLSGLFRRRAYNMHLAASKTARKRVSVTQIITILCSVISN
uniref:Uncharacterized protein n=1 Tax=Felis catus TaxID=9685 RepID=A0ABI7VQ75_FELCA